MKLSKKDTDIIANAKEVVKWMKDHGWDKAKKCPDPIAAEIGGFNTLLMKLCDAVDKD